MKEKGGEENYNYHERENNYNNQKRGRERENNSISKYIMNEINYNYL